MPQGGPAAAAHAAALPTKTVLVIVSYPPIAAWVRDCLATPSQLVITAERVDSALRLAMLVSVDAVVVWPALSGGTVADALEVASAIGGTRSQVPVLIASWVQPCSSRPNIHWMVPPIVAEDLRRTMREMLQARPYATIEHPGLTATSLKAPAEGPPTSLAKAS